MTTPTPDVREIAARAAFDFQWSHADHADWSQVSPGGRTWYLLIADAVLSAVTPVIRQQERVKVAEELDEMIDLRRRAASKTARDRESDTRQQVYSNGQTVAYHELAERLDRYFAERAAAVARSHVQHRTGES